MSMRLATSKRSRGQALVEFALVIPVFLVMLFAVIDAGRLIYLNSTVSQAAREAARLASVEASWIGSSDPACGMSGGPVCPANASGLTTHAVSAANRMMSPFAPVGTADLTMRCDTSSPPSGSWSGNTCAPGANASSGSVVSVRVRSTFVPLTPVLSQLVGPIVLSGSASMGIN
jgi:hypothetical protein